MPTSEGLRRALCYSSSDEDRFSMGIAMQEAIIESLLRLMVEKVLTGAKIHRLLAGLSKTGHVRRLDLLEWAEMFM